MKKKMTHDQYQEHTEIDTLFKSHVLECGIGAAVATWQIKQPRYVLTIPAQN
jgi:hypothetical protein